MGLFTRTRGAAQTVNIMKEVAANAGTLGVELCDIAGNVVAGKAGKNGRGPYMRLIADTIIDPDEIWADWRAVTSGVVLMRSYLKRFVLPGGVNLLARFEWTSKGWIAVTGFDGSATYLQRLRTGALLYRRP